jgi:glutamine amidotransferase
MVTIGIMDYKAGNIRSVLTAVRYLGAEGIISADPDILRKCDKLIIPGDGEAQAVMEVLRSSSLGEFLLRYFQSGRPILGICIGCQIILEKSEERSTPCLGFIPGEVVRFPQKPGLKVPHMGWNQVHHENSHPIFHGVREDSPCYFVHSYYPVPRFQEHAAAWTEYGVPFVSALKKENLVAVQFHPEKSASLGLKMIENFIFRC